MIIKQFLLFTACAFTFLSSGAQDRNTLGLRYQYALPMGGFKNDLISEGSPRGFSADLMHALNPQWRIGASLGYQDFYQKNARNTYRMGDGSDISAVVSNSLQTTALMAQGMYFPKGADSSRLQPYVSAGAGVNMVQYSQLLGEFSNGDDVWLRFAAQAGAGLQYRVGNGGRTALMLGVAYNYMPLNKMEVKNVNNLAIQAGVRIAMRNSGRSNNRSGDVWQRRPNHYGGRW